MNFSGFFLNFDITNYCNASCPTCLRQQGKENHKKRGNLNTVNVDFSLYKKIVLRDRDFLKDKICKFCGELGDPIMHPKLENFIDVSSPIFKQVEVHTNGSARNTEWIKKIMKKYKNLYFVFAIDGATEEINSLYRVGVNFNLAFNNMIAGSKIENKRIKWVFTVFPWNKHQIKEIKKIREKYKMNLKIRENVHKAEHDTKTHKKIYHKWKNEKKIM
jgi:MoaA/NifB/PqqE/SkfB family radical SAM enzyme